eukprot:4029673-Pyramimonas_sp.AAC.1
MEHALRIGSHVFAVCRRPSIRSSCLFLQNWRAASWRSESRHGSCAVRMSFLRRATRRSGSSYSRGAVPTCRPA